MFVAEFAKGEFARLSGVTGNTFAVAGSSTFEAVGSVFVLADWDDYAFGSALWSGSWISSRAFTAPSEAVVLFSSSTDALASFSSTSPSVVGFVGSRFALSRFDLFGSSEWLAPSAAIRVSRFTITAPSTLVGRTAVGLTSRLVADSPSGGTWRGSITVPSSFSGISVSEAQWQPTTGIRAAQFASSSNAEVVWRTEPLNKPGELILRGRDDRLIYWK